MLANFDVKIVNLPLSEQTEFDQDLVFRLVRRLGDASATATITRVMEDISHRDARLTAAIKECRFDDAALDARRIDAIAAQIGLHTVARAAANLATVVAGVDPITTAALTARLNRAVISAWQEPRLMPVRRL